MVSDAPGNTLTLERLSALGFDLSGLSVRGVEPGDVDLAEQWWEARHPGSPLPAALLPPLGVVIEDTVGPAGMLWCYESFGVGVGFLEFPVTRPGLSMRAAGTVMALAVCACCHLAGQSTDPPGEFRVFRVATPGPIARFLTRLGFRFADFGTPLRGLLLVN